MNYFSKIHKVTRINYWGNYEEQFFQTEKMRVRKEANLTIRVKWLIIQKWNETENSTNPNHKSNTPVNQTVHPWNLDSTPSTLARLERETVCSTAVMFDAFC